MLNWRLGTVGFGYSDWAGVFYPAGMKSSQYLPWYARHFDTVELDTTFHAAPTRERVRQWAAAVPEGFRFCVKTPKAVTHEGRVDAAIPAFRAFVDTLREFGPKLAAVLMQFPPSFTRARRDELRRLLEVLPGDMRFAVELRDTSWRVQSTGRLLQDHRCAWTTVDSVDMPPDLIVTSDFLYVRFIGQHDRFAIKNREQVDPTPELEVWKTRIESAFSRPADVYGFFNNDYAGYAVATARRMQKLLGLPTRSPLPDQPTLF
jgi:uncharacterized protein YecE (DUF72 family)